MVLGDGQIAGGDFANRPRAESTESTESFQPHFLGRRTIRRKTVTKITLLPEPTGQNIPYFPYIPQRHCTKRQTARVQPAPSEAQGSWCSCQAAGQA